jgi:hypothetical protein
MKPNTIVLTVCPDRQNIRYSVHSLKKGEIEMDKLKWIVEMANHSGCTILKTIIFCNTYNEIAAVLAYLMRVLGDAAYLPGQPKCPSNIIVAIYHSMTWKKYKDRVVESFKNDNGNARIVLAFRHWRRVLIFPMYVMSFTLALLGQLLTMYNRLDEMVNKPIILSFQHDQSLPTVKLQSNNL